MRRGSFDTLQETKKAQLLTLHTVIQASSQHEETTPHSKILTASPVPDIVLKPTFIGDDFDFDDDNGVLKIPI